VQVQLIQSVEHLLLMLDEAVVLVLMYDEVQPDEQVVVEVEVMVHYKMYLVHMYRVEVKVLIDSEVVQVVD